jgi:glycosyltransferase involved in cell wall biosynthesis
MNKSINLSVITVNLNNIAGFRKTIFSIFKQINVRYELIVIDGGSTDGSLDLLKKYNSLIHYWVSEQDNGVYHAMNKGLEQATGDYCIFLNSGDYFFDKNVLSNVDNLLDRSSDISYGLIQWEDTLKYWNPRRNIKPFEMAFKSLVPHQGVFFKTEVLKNMGGYIESYKVVSDWALLLAIHNKSRKIQKIELVISMCEKQGISSTYEALAKKERMNYLLNYDKKTFILGVLYQIKKRFFS